MPRETLKFDTGEKINLKKDPNKDPLKRIYRTHQWIQFRKKHLAEQRAKDEARAQLMYMRDEQVSLMEYHDWLMSGMPLCTEYFSEGRMIPAKILDHIKPISQGGEVFSKCNLQWLSEEKHNQKRGRERHQ
jgi:hypothetical protein